MGEDERKGKKQSKREQMKKRYQVSPVLEVGLRGRLRWALLDRC